MLLTLEQTIVLEDALGKHTCECGHPEMLLLPDGVFHCPSCRLEVLPIESSYSLSIPSSPPQLFFSKAPYNRARRRSEEERQVSR